jgi:hypothetical protein
MSIASAGPDAAGRPQGPTVDAEAAAPAPDVQPPTQQTTAAGGGGLPVIFRTRPSARFGAPKPRPLYAKLELLLDLMYRRLYWDPSQPESVFSVDALLRAVRKVDKELGP